MNVFDLDRALIRDYEHFARSFTQIRALDIRSQVESIYANDRFWPEPLISINPRFELGASIGASAEIICAHSGSIGTGDVVRGLRGPAAWAQSL